MSILSMIAIAIGIQALVSVAAIFLVHKDSRKGILSPAYLCFSAGTFLGIVFFDLLPESFEALDAHTASLWTLAGFLFFFAISHTIHWYHHHNDCDDGHSHRHASGYLVLIGDAFHNLFDGALIAAAFVADPALGIMTALAVTAHEIPQEVSDYAVLLHSGWTRMQALRANLFSAFASVIGAGIGYFFTTAAESAAPLIAIAAGNFLFLAASDLIPRFAKAGKRRERFGQLAVFFLGLALMLVLTQFGGHEH